MTASGEGAPKRVLAILGGASSGRPTSGVEIRRHHMIRGLQKAGAIDLLVLSDLVEAERLRINEAYGFEDVCAWPVPADGQLRLVDVIWGGRLATLGRSDLAALRRLVLSRESATSPDVTFVECVEHFALLRGAITGQILIDLDDIGSEVIAQRQRLARRAVIDTSSSRHLAGLPEWLRTIFIVGRRLPRAITRDLLLTKSRLAFRIAERTALREVSTVFLCSEADFELLGSPVCAVVVPNGQAVHATSSPTFHPSGPPVIAFWGVLTYGPNADGAGWFIDEVLPLLIAARPDLRMKLIGRGGDRLFQSSTHLDVLGFAEDLASALSDVAVAVVPLRMGGGTRIKIVEAWARGIPVVSTSLGAYGLDAQSGEELLLADDAVAFAQAVLTLLADVEQRRRVIEKGLVKAANLTWSSVEEVVAAAVRSAANPGL